MHARARICRSLPGWGAGALSLLCLVWLSGCGGPRWLFDAGSAYRRARETDRPVLVYYRSGMCQYCAKMDREVFTDARVRGRLDEFVLLQRDFGTFQFEARRLGITGTPGFVVHRPNGSVVGPPAVGQMSPAEFRAFLAAAKLQR